MFLSKEVVATVKSSLMGAAVGGAVLVVVGFNWGGWVTGGNAEKIADRKTTAAVVLALSPICVDNFRRQADAGVQLVNFQRLPSYDQSSFVQKGGWAAALGSKEYNTAITHACAQSLSDLTAADLG